MITTDQTIILILSMFVGYFARELPRAVFWVSCLVGIYFFTSWWWVMDLPNPAFVAAVLDGALACQMLISTRSKREAWQFGAALIVQAMILVNIGYVAFGLTLNIGAVHHWTLEALNFAVLLTIGGTAIFEKLGRYDFNPYFRAMRNVRATLRSIVPGGKEPVV